ncbi:MAG: efflux RND transporter periplasmic adaptor subunit [Planctomycetota bacterium]
MPDSSPAPTRRILAIATRVGVAVLMLVVAGLIYFALYSTKPEVEVIDPEANRPSIVVFRAEAVPVQRQWRGYGTADALDSADVPARVTATVDFIPNDIRAGSPVAHGQLLVQLDASDFTRQLDIATQRIAEIEAAIAQLDVEDGLMQERLALEDSNVAIAQTEYDRQLRFQQRDVATQQDVDAAQRNLINAKRSRLQLQEASELISPRRRSLQAQKASQQSQVNLAELNQQRASITSPIAGVLQSIDVEVGENLQAGQSVARVVSLDHIEVPIQLPAAARRSVAVGDAVELRPTNPQSSNGNPHGTTVWTTTVNRVAPEQNAATRTFTVFAEPAVGGTSTGTVAGSLPNPGMFLEATVSAARVEPRFVVPRSAVRAGRVQVVEDGKLVSRAVDVDFNLSGHQPVFGLRDDQWAVINDGVLREGDLVVANASINYADGTEVVAQLSNPDDGSVTPGPQAAPVSQEEDSENVDDGESP